MSWYTEIEAQRSRYARSSPAFGGVSGGTQLLGTPDFEDVDPVTGARTPGAWARSLSQEQIDEVYRHEGNVEFTLDADGNAVLRRDALGRLIPGRQQEWFGLPWWAWALGALFVVST